jgi:hypothetical protein
MVRSVQDPHPSGYPRRYSVEGQVNPLQPIDFPRTPDGQVSPSQPSELPARDPDGQVSPSQPSKLPNPLGTATAAAAVLAPYRTV